MAGQPDRRPNSVSLDCSKRLPGFGRLPGTRLVDEHVHPCGRQLFDRGRRVPVLERDKCQVETLPPDELLEVVVERERLVARRQGGAERRVVESRCQRLAHRRIRVVQGNDLDLVCELLEALHPSRCVVVVDPYDGKPEPGHRTARAMSRSVTRADRERRAGRLRPGSRPAP